MKAKNMQYFYGSFSAIVKSIFSGINAKFVVLLVVALGMWGGARGETVTYTIESTSSVSTSGTAPQGSSATFNNTYTNNKVQITSGNSMTLTLNGFDGYKITAIRLSMRSNKTKGGGSFSAIAGTTTIASISDSKFNTSNWNGAWSTSFVNVIPTMTNASYVIQNRESIVITINASESSLYCESFTITYEAGVVAPCTTLLAPTNLSESNLTATSVHLSWDAVANVSSYLVTITDGDNTIEKTPTYNSVDVTGLTPSTEYLWSVKAIGNGSTYCDSEESQTGDFTTSAQTYSVTYNANGGTGSVPTDNNSYSSGAQVTVLGNTGNLAKTCYTFAGWNTKANGSGVSYSANSTFNITANTTLYAQWNHITYTVSKGPETNGTFTLSPSPTVNCGGSVTVSATPNDCYKVASVSATNGSATGSGNSWTVSNITANTTISVTFEALARYNVTWHVSGQSNVVDNYCLGSTITAPSNPASCDGEKVFMGWATLPVAETDNAPTLYSKAQIDGTTVSQNLDYYAVFATANGSAESWVQVTELSNITEGVYVIVNGGFYLPNTRSTSSPSAISLGTSIQNNEISEDMQWFFTGTYTEMTIRPNIENTRYYLYEINDSKGIRVDGTQGTWAFETNGSGTFAMKGNYNRYCAVYISDWRAYVANDNYQDGGKLYLYKKTGGISYSGYTTSCEAPTTATITFNANGGSGTMAQQVVDIDVSTALNSNTFTAPAGKYFSGWNTAANGSGTSYTNGQQVSLSQNITLYAQWAAYTVSAQSNDNNLGTVSLGGYVITATPASCNQYANPAYSVSPAGAATVVQDGDIFSVTPTGDCTVTINFETRQSYNVTWHVSGQSDDVDNYCTGSTLTAPSNPASCDGEKVFVGWATATVEETDIAPTLYSKAQIDGTTVSENLDYYAVFANTNGASGNWERVTDVSTLAVDDKIVIAASEYDYAMSTVQNTNNRGQADITKRENTITIGNNVCVFTLKAGSVNGTWSFYDGAGYLYAASSSNNHLKTGTDLDANGSWKIDFDNNVASIIAQGSYSHNVIRYNNTSSLFACYASETNQKAVSLYKKDEIVYSAYTTTCCLGDRYPVSFSPSSYETYTNYETRGLIASHEGEGAGTWSITSSPEATTLQIASDGTITFEAPTAGTYKLTAKFTPSADGTCPTTNSINVVVNDCSIETVEPTYTATFNSITLSWSQVQDAEKYEIIWDGDEDESMYVVGNDTVIENLLACTEYPYIIKAIPEDGTGRCASVYNGSAYTECTYRNFDLVTSAEDLVAGEQYIIASGYSGSVKILGKQDPNNRKPATVEPTVSNGRISISGNDIARLSSDAKVYVLELGGSLGRWTLYDAVSEGYLYAASSDNNYLKTQAPNDSNGEWSISFGANGAAKGAAKGGNTHKNLRYNSTNTLFSCYSTEQNPIYFYRESSIIKVSTNIVEGFGYCEGGDESPVQTFTVSARRIEALTIKLTAVENYELCQTENGTYSSTISLPVTDNALAETTVYARLKNNLGAGNYVETITVDGYDGETKVVEGPMVQLSGAVSVPEITSIRYSCATNGTVTLDVASTCTEGNRFAIAIRKGTLLPHERLNVNVSDVVVGYEFGSGEGTRSKVIYLNDEEEVPETITINDVELGETYKVRTYHWNGSSWDVGTTCTVNMPRITDLSYSDLPGNKGAFSWSISNSVCGSDYNYYVVYSTDHISDDCSSISSGHNAGMETSYFTTDELTPETTYYARVFLKINGEESCLASDEILFEPRSITQLELGDLAIVGINNTIVSGGADEISFVIFKDITRGTPIDFTDNGYERVYEGRWGTTEGFLRLIWKGEQPLEAGSIITITESQNNIGANGTYGQVYYNRPPVIGGNITIYTNGSSENQNQDWEIVSLIEGPLDLNDWDQIWFMQGGLWVVEGANKAYYTGNVLYGFTASGWLDEANFDGKTIGGQKRGTKGSTMYNSQDCFATTLSLNNGMVKYIGTIPSDAEHALTKREWMSKINDPDNWRSYNSASSYISAQRNYRSFSGRFYVKSGDAFTAGKWAGTKSGEWCKCANWSSLAVPTEENDVIVPQVSTHELLLVAGDANMAKCKTLTIQDGGTITNEDGAKLMVANNITIDNGGTFEPTSGNELSLYLGGDVVNNGTFKTSEKMSLTLTSENAQSIPDVSSGDFVLNNLTFTADGHTFAADEIKLYGDYNATENGLESQPISFVGTDQQKITNTTVISNLTMNNSGDGVVITSGHTLTITDEATFTDGALQGNVIFTADATVAGDLTYNSYVQGSVTKKACASAFTFPNGSNGMLGTVSVAAGKLTADATVTFGHDPEGFSTDVMPSWWNQNNMCEGDGDNEKFDHVSNMLNWNVSTAADIQNVTFSAISSEDVQFNEEPTNERNEDAIKVAVYDRCWKNAGGTASVTDRDSHHEITITGVDVAATRRASGQITFGSTEKTTILPIELLSFSARCEGSAVAVSWSTASESDNDYFVLERSADAKNFSEIARISGAGNSIETLYYSFNDKSANNGDNYYRLVQVDYDGTRTVSEIVVATCYGNEISSNPNVEVYPNPFADEFTVMLENFNGNAEVEIFDMLGRLVYSRNVSAKGVCELNVDFDFAPATYNLRITSGDVVINKQIVKQ